MSLLKKMIKLKLYRDDGTTVNVLILKHKNTETYSYINLTKGHICPCKFNSVEEAIKDLENYIRNLK